MEKSQVFAKKSHTLSLRVLLTPRCPLTKVLKAWADHIRNNKTFFTNPINWGCLYPRKSQGTPETLDCPQRSIVTCCFFGGFYPILARRLFEPEQLPPKTLRKKRHLDPDSSPPRSLFGCNTTSPLTPQRLY